MMEFNLQSAFYVFNLVANWAYARWDLISPAVISAIQTKEKQYLQEIQSLDSKLLAMTSQSAAKSSLEEKKATMASAIAMATDYAVTTGNQLVQDWFKFFGQLFVQYRDGYNVTPNPSSTSCGCSAASANYPQQWRDRIVQDTGSHYLYGTPESTALLEKREGQKLSTKPKTQLKAFQ